MAGGKFPAEKLNDVLQKILKLLNENGIENWFIGYGTLLGIVRNDSCINNDDDIDILIDVKQKTKVDEIFKEKGFNYSYNMPMFSKIRMDPGMPTVDFYYCNVDEEGNFQDTWERVKWTRSTPLIQKEWRDTVLYIPQNHETKLEGRYGADWKTPKQSKGVVPRKKEL